MYTVYGFPGRYDQLALSLNGLGGIECTSHADRVQSGLACSPNGSKPDHNGLCQSGITAA